MRRSRGRRSVRVACALAVRALAIISPLIAAEGSTHVRRVSNFPTTAGDQRGAPTSLLAFGDGVLYVSRHYGELALWVSDGTAGGTRLLREICSSCDLESWVVHGSVAFLRILDYRPSPSRESLWRSDGTVAGTYPLTASLPALDPWSSTTLDIVPAGTLVYASFADGLRSSDGTVAGTQRLDREVFAFDLVAWGDEVYFLGWRRDGGDGLWRASRETGLVEIRSLSSCDFYPTSLVRASERLFFVAEKSGRELWTSDGTAAGTVAVTDFRTPEALVDYTVLTPLGSRVWFQAKEGKQGWQVWSSDGTRVGTKAATEFRGARPWGFEWDDAEPMWPGAQLAQLGGRTLFAAAAPSGDEAQLWTTNGEPASTARMHGCARGCPLVFEEGSFAVLGDRAAFFGYRPPDHATSLWISDGTGPGTLEIPLAQDCETSSVPRELVAVGGRWFFTDAGALWATDGTPAGKVRLAAFSDELSLSWGPAIAAGPNGVFFAGIDERGASGLWQTAGAGAREIFTPPAERDSDVGGLLGVAGNRVLLHAAGGCWSADAASLVPLPAAVSRCGGDGEEVTVVGERAFVEEAWESHYGDRVSFWSTDGTPEGTTTIKLDEADVRSNVVPWDDGRVALFASAGGLWTSDGTAAGTALLVPLTDDVWFLRVAGDHVYFTLDDDTKTTRLWSSDGTSAGTRPISPAWHHTSGVPSVVGDRVYVLAQESTTAPLAIWSVPRDGSAAELLPLSAIGAAYGATLSTAAGRLWFAGSVYEDDGTYRPSLWAIDGALDRVWWLPVPLSEQPWQLSLTALGGAVYLSTADAAHGRELWRTKGTAADTALVSDVAPGLADANPEDVVAWRGRLFLAADDGTHGRELWSTDGTAAGTRLAADLAPGPRGSRPANLMVAGDRLYFTANDGETGRQLWTMH